MPTRTRPKRVCGIGVNNADYVVDGLAGRCPYYAKWLSMLQRTTSQWQTKWPSYIGCCVCEEWKAFSTFKRWMTKQDWLGKELDKDLLGDGKIYSPENCVFVSKAVNYFTNGHAASRGQYPIGVTFHEKTGKFVSQVSTPTKRLYLGLFNTSAEAYEVWRKAKLKLCKELIKQQTDPRVKKGLRRYAKKLHSATINEWQPVVCC